MVVMSSCEIDLIMLAMLGSDFFPTFILVACYLTIYKVNSRLQVDLDVVSF